MSPFFYVINTSMTELNALARQPTNTNLTTATQFRFSIIQLPKTEFFIKACTLPGINMGEAIFPTPFRDLPVLPDKLVYDNLEVTFLVDENLENYREIHNWMVGIAFPKERTQFANFRQSNNDRAPASPSQGSRDVVLPDSAMYADATLTVLTNKNNPVVRANFSNVYPVALSGLDYTSAETDSAPIEATVTFQYSIYDFETIGL